MNRKWIALIVIAVAFALGAAAYFAVPLFQRTDTTQSAEVNPTAASQVPQATGQTAAAMCVGPASTQATQTALKARYRWAHTLMQQKLFDAALPELRDIAALDPGFPGIHLDISNSLVQMNRPDEAKLAIDSQIEISECLSKLPADGLEAYCKSELSSPNLDSCQPELTRISRAAQSMSALVHVELERGQPAGNINTASLESHSQLPRTLARPTTAAPRKAAGTAHAAAPRKSSGDKTLMDGDGTDSALGAYSKP